MTLPLARFVGSTVVGVLLAAGVSYCLMARSGGTAEAAGTTAPTADSGIDALLDASFEAKYAGIPERDLVPLTKELYEQLLARTRVDADQRIAEGAFEDFPYDPEEKQPLSPEGVAVAAGIVTLSGPEGARVARHVVVPEGYDAELDLLRLEYSWLVGKVGDWRSETSSEAAR